MVLTIRLIGLLTLIGILHEFRPSDPYVVEFLLCPDKNFTRSQLVEDIFPISIYSGIFFQILVILFTDVCGYKPIIIIAGIFGIITYTVLSIGKSFLDMAIVEVFYGAILATETAFFAYPYKKVATDEYQKVTGIVKGSTFVGAVCSALLTETLLRMKLATYLRLTYITLSAMILKTVICIALEPTEKRSDGKSPQTLETINKILQTMNEYRKQLATDAYFRKWLIFHTFLMSLNAVVISNIQVIWNAINVEKITLKNGYVDVAVHTGNALASFMIGYVAIDWRKYGVVMTSILLCEQCVNLIMISFSTSIHASYILYILFRFVSQILFTIVTSEVAKSVNNEAYAYIFGINTCASFVLQTVIVHLFLKKHFLDLDLRELFTTFGILHVIPLFLLSLSSFREFKAEIKEQGE